MPPDSEGIGSAREWIKRAKSNLARAKQPKTAEIFWEDLCFDAQQAAEKSLKAILIAHDIPFRFVHDLAELLTSITNHGIPIPDNIHAAAELTNYAVESRYPGPAEPVTEDEFRDALQKAELVVAWAETHIEEEK
ncbi:MAG: HEPN domain-containing protein [Deltaproteobacteria bacterium]|nr:HEPN domain-containing protein [Deltaproteobacteria bacterium]